MLNSVNFEMAYELYEISQQILMVMNVSNKLMMGFGQQKHQSGKESKLKCYKYPIHDNVCQ